MADDANPQVRVTLTAEDAGLSSALKQLSDELKRLDSQQQTTASSAVRAGRAMGEATGGIRSQIGLLDNTIRGAHAQAMADLVRRFSDSALVMNLLPIGATVGGFVLLGGIVVDLVRKFEALRNSQQEIAAAEQKLQTQSNETMGRLGDEVLRARMEVDKLSGNSLKALREQLELIDHQSMTDLISQFAELNKALLDFLKPLQTQPWELWDLGSEQVQKDMTELQANITKIKSEMGLLDPASEQYRSDQVQINKLLDDAVTKYQSIVDLQKHAPTTNTLDARALGFGIGAAILGPGAGADLEQRALMELSAGYGANEKAAAEQALKILEIEKQSVGVEQKRADLQRRAAEIRAAIPNPLSEESISDMLRQRAQTPGYAKRIEDAKRAAEGLLSIENQLTRAESEAARAALNERAGGARGQSTLDQQAAQELNAAKAQTLRLDEQIAERSGDDKKRQQLEIAQEQIQLSRVQEELTKANLLGQTELAAALTREAQSWRTLIQAQQRALQVNQAITSMESAMNTLFDAAIKGSGGVKQAFVGMEESIITSLERSLAAMVVNAAQQKSLLEGTKLSSAAASARDAFRSAITALPFPINLPVAAGWAAAAFAASMAFAQGGLVRGPGGPTGDRIPAMLSDGEFVMRASAVQNVGAHNLEAINAGLRAPATARALDVGVGSFASSLHEGDIRPAGGVEVHMHPQIVLQHHGDDAKTVLEHELAPMITDMFRRGALQMP